MTKLASTSARARESALQALAEHPAENVIGPVAELLLEDSSDHVQATCLDLLEGLGAVVSLADVRADGWFEQFGAQISQFDKICEVMGERFLAYSIILGIQVRSLITDPQYPSNATIEFTVDDDEIQALSLAEFRIRVVQAVIKGLRHPAPASLPLTVEDAASVLGGKNLLLAPLFDISVDQLILAEVDDEQPRALVGYISDGGYNLIDVRDFDELMRGKVRRDLAGTSEEPMRLDLSVVVRAREAFRKGDLGRVVELLESWPGLLSILLRTPVMRGLEDDQRTAIGEGLELLGAAFEEQDRHEWSEELYKLGLQFVREGSRAGTLCHRLGALLARKDRHAEAIGVLRRARQLGVGSDGVLPILARSFIETGKVVAARGLLEELVAEGEESQEIIADLERVRGVFEEAGVVWMVPSAGFESRSGGD